jgi:hypothetical protein
MSREKPKSETRNPKEGRSPKHGSRRGVQRDFSAFGFRPSFGLRPSVVRFLLQGAYLTVAQRVLAATNLISSDEIPPLRPPHAELPPSLWERYGLAIIVLLVGLMVVLGIFVWIITRPKPAALIPPAIRARRELEPLANRAEDGAVLSRVSQVLRHYVAAAFGLPPGEITTAEFCRALIPLDKMGPPVSVPLTDFLRECDRRKFAPNVGGSNPPEAVSRALGFIDACETRLAQLRQVAASPAVKP